MPSASDTVTKIGAWIIFAGFAAIIFWKGVWPSLQNARGDFANYYTAARLVAENKPLATAYRDVVWFQKQIDRYGITHQLGGFIPHPPPAALVMLPLAPFGPLLAKRLWIGFNLALVIAAVVLLAKMTALPSLPAAIILLSTGTGLINNFLFGQMYLLVLTTIAGGIYLQQRGHPVLGGIALGSMIPVKYVGGFFLLYYLWKKEWRLVFAATATGAAMIGIIFLLQGAEIFRVFISEVLPRHLQGEIQDPFAIQFQSWNSLLRRMFVSSPSLNPQPPMESAFLFILLKNLLFWFWLAAFIWMYRQTTFSNQAHQKLFEIGLIPLAVLLVSPGSATYHFLLLSLTVACFVKILLDLNQPGRAIAVSVLFLIINLPHYMQMKKFATGWLTPLGYTRLWLLLFFFALSVYFFYRAANWRWQLKIAGKYFLVVLILGGITMALDFRRAAAKEQDEAQWLPLREPEFDRHLGLLVKTPEGGRQRVVFCYGEGFDEDYAIFSMTRDGQIEGQWTPDAPQNFYDPDLSTDDHSVLMESMQNGRPEIWLSRGKNSAPEFLLEGENPSWHSDEIGFAFLRNGQIGLAGVQNHGVIGPWWLAMNEVCYDLAFSPVDNQLVFCANRAAERDFILAVATAVPGNAEKEILLQSPEPMERPVWSPEASSIVFSWNRNGNRDLWAINRHTRQLQRLTRDPAIDTAPVWDEVKQRILFTSDRGRGLEFSTLFWIAVPNTIKKHEVESAGL
ncbi:MAG: glycosyltransferase 87 family protein [candidate division KSB1 bacterium]|nr:glycosyltransferase 87 family protein [candidate division KSB1 bacterium]MDZ7365867.1 glycosyltransferase 87 family protein [candidate division KSB1 bacterium]MDZ7403898.1 glycosyltransferase 87 family protein [candidate division KSB1 bacterium]